MMPQVTDHDRECAQRMINCGLDLEQVSQWVANTAAERAEIKRLQTSRRRLLEAIEEHFDGGEGMWLHADVEGPERELRNEYEQQVRVDLTCRGPSRGGGVKDEDE